jgi:hypothetical protein
MSMAVSYETAIDSKEGMMTNGEYMRYLGCLKILCECSVYLDAEPELRECIIDALEDACRHHPLKWRRIINRLEIEPKELDEA